MTPADQRMLDNERGALWQGEARAYTVITEGTVTTPSHTGLSHPAAMKVADELRRVGRVATVVHVVGDHSYEVDRYPVR